MAEQLNSALGDLHLGGADTAAAQACRCVAAKPEDPEQLAALLRGGVSPSAQGSSGMFDTWSLLHIAAWHGQAGHADLLLGMRADVSATNRKGDTALRLAAHKGQLAVARLLVQAQANPTTTNISGLNALQSAASTDSASSVELCALLEQVTRDRRLEQLVGGERGTECDSSKVTFIYVRRLSLSLGLMSHRRARLSPSLQLALMIIIHWTLPPHRSETLPLQLAPCLDR